MQRKPKDTTKGANKDRAQLPRPTEEDYKGLYDDLMTLRQSWVLLRPTLWNQDTVPHITKDPYPEQESDLN